MGNETVYRVMNHVDGMTLKGDFPPMVPAMAE